MQDVARLTNLLRTYRNNQCLLFVGAGFSLGALRTGEGGKSLPLPSGKDLVSLLKDKLCEEIDDLGALADLYEDQFGEHGLYTLLSSLFVANSVTPTQNSIANFNWKEIYTTNYDNVLQLSLTQSGRRFSTYTPLKRPNDIDYRTLPIIHINGFVEGTTFNDFRKELKLTSSQYYSDDFSRSAWGERFRNDILTAPCIVFAGYSLYDLDVARILNTFEGMQDRIFFVFKGQPSRAVEKKLHQYGTILAIGTEGLANLLDEIGNSTIETSQPHFSGWEKIALPQTPKPTRDIDVINFLMSGNVNQNQFAMDVIEQKFKVAINRPASDQICNLIEQNSLKYALVISNIGNGKTTLLDAVCYKLAARGVQVFRASTQSSILLKEVPLFRQLQGKIVLVVDDAFSNLDTIRAIHALGRDDVCIVTSARTAQFELQQNEVRSALANEAEIFSLDELDGNEIDALRKFLDNYALWGERQSLAPDKKESFIRSDCSRELRYVILETLDSPNIRSRIQVIWPAPGFVDTHLR